MKFAYEDLSDDQFEVLIVLLCQRLLGIAVQGFAKGPDGGRDAKFVGTAELHPSKAAPWVGTVIVQAKHTNGYNRSFSELDFYSTSSSNTVVGKEVPRIKKLRDAKQLDHYMLFANRRLTGNSETEIRDHIAAAHGRDPLSHRPLAGLKIVDVGSPELFGVRQVPGVGNVVIGSAKFFSPEQATGRAADARSDLFSVGTLRTRQ